MCNTIEEAKFKQFRLKTYREGLQLSQPHFFILSKGRNSGKPLKVACPNCFVCFAHSEQDKERLYWLCFGLWKSKAFHYFLHGSVIEFVRLQELADFIGDQITRAHEEPKKFEKAVAQLVAIDAKEQSMKNLFALLDQLRQTIFYQFMNGRKEVKNVQA
jgi:hypothetical protein